MPGNLQTICKNKAYYRESTILRYGQLFLLGNLNTCHSMVRLFECISASNHTVRAISVSTLTRNIFPSELPFVFLVVRFVCMFVKSPTINQSISIA